MDLSLWTSLVTWAVLGLSTVLVGWFALTCLLEREWRAFFLIDLLCLPALGILLTLLLLEFPGRSWVLAGILVLVAGASLLLVIPFGRKEPGCQRVGESERVDERDAVFHRFRRLQPGTPEYLRYYRKHPELENFDQDLRSRPDIGLPGSRDYHPLSSVYMQALFKVSEQVGSLADLACDGLESKAVPVTPADASLRLKGLASQMGADLVGCCRLDPAWVYSHVGRGPGTWGEPIELDHGWALAVGVEMDWNLVRHAPGTASTTETAWCYLKAAAVAGVLAQVIQLWGYKARTHQDGNYRVLCVPIAEQAGLGEMGRHGLLIAPRFGPRVRLAVVTTELELAPDRPIDLGARQFCAICKKCATHCPSGAVDSGPERELNGVVRWQTDRDQCFRLWRKFGTDCGLCIRACPYAKPSRATHQLVRWAIARNPIARQLAYRLDDLLYGRRLTQRYPLPDWHAQAEPPREGPA